MREPGLIHKISLHQRPKISQREDLFEVFIKTSTKKHPERKSLLRPAFEQVFNEDLFEVFTRTYLRFLDEDLFYELALGSEF